MELIKQHKGMAIAIAGLVVLGALWAGVPAGTLLLVAVVLACPLMMLTMHGGGHSGHGGTERNARPDPGRDPYGTNGNGNGPTESDPHAAHRHPTDTRPW